MGLAAGIEKDVGLMEIINQIILFMRAHGFMGFLLSLLVVCLAHKTTTVEGMTDDGTRKWSLLCL